MGKKILLITAIILGTMLAFAAAVPFLFGDKLKKIAEKELNEQLTANSSFKDVSISFFRNFPKLSVGLEQLYIGGPGNFSSDTLLVADRMDIAINLFSLFGSGPVKVNNVVFNKPSIHLMVDEKGEVNWDIMKSAEETGAKDTSASEVSVELNRYEVIDGRLRYDDVQADMHMDLSQLNHIGSGNFTADNFLLETATTAGEASFTYAGIPYLVKTKTAIDAAIDVNLPQNKYSFAKAKATINELKIDGDGFFQLVNDSTYNMDIVFKTPSNEFRDILSLVPAIYQKDFKDLTTKGTAAFEGFVRGIYAPGKIPAYSVNAIIKDGFFQYPDLPKPVKEINLQLKASNVDGQPDNTIIDISNATLKFGEEPFSFRVLYKNPETIQYIDAAAKGNLDLGTIGQFVKLEEGTKLSGQVKADISGKGNLNVVLKQQPGPFQANGFFELSNLLYASKEFPQPIRNTSATILVSNTDGIADNTVVKIPAGHAEFGTDKIDFSLLLTNPATDPNFDVSAKGGFQLDRVKQFYTFEPGTSIDGHLDADMRIRGKKSFVDQEKYDAVQSSGTIVVKDLIYKTPEYQDGFLLKNAVLNLAPKDIEISNANGSFMQTSFNGSGKIHNAIGYALKDEPLSGTMNLKAGKVDLNKWMGTTPAGTKTSQAATKPFEVPANIRFNISTDIDEVVYDNVSYKNVKGGLTIANETVSLDNLTMQALDGGINLNGSYSTRLNKAKPAISLAFQLSNLDVQKTFNAFNTVKFLMPIGEFITGKLSSGLTVNGTLGEEMMPDLGSLTGNGMILLIEGFLSKFKPLEVLADKLKIESLQNISFKDVKQYFEFVNGKVLVKPFTVKVNDIDMEIGGMHGFDQSLDYIINLKVPRSKLGTGANQVVDGLVGELTKKGIPVKLGETVSLKVKMGGSIKSPTLSYNLQDATESLATEMKDLVRDLAMEQKAKADSALGVAKQAAKDSLEAIREKAVQEAKKKVKEQIFGRDSTSAKDTLVARDTSSGQAPKKASDAAKGLIKDILKKKKPAVDTTQKQQ